MKHVYVVTDKGCGHYGIYSTEEKANIAAKEVQHNLLAGGYSYAQVEVLKMEVE